MRLPNGERAVIEARKIKGYVLSATHPVGRFKAVFFGALGFNENNWTELEIKLRQLAWQGTAEIAERNAYGQKYIVRGRIKGPERSARVVTVWIILDGEHIPRFVTAYPED